MTAANLTADLKAQLGDLKARLQQLEAALDIQEKQDRVAVLDDKMSAPDFWNDQATAQTVQRERTTIDTELKAFQSAWQAVSDCLELVDMADEDESTLNDIAADAERAAEAVQRLEMGRMLRGKTDRNNAIININVGQGGSDAQEFCEMLLRMYTRYAEKRGFGTELTDIVDAEPSGIKSATLLVKGDYAYGFLKAEMGVHRLVRMSPFSGKRETSFAGVSVIPEVTDDIDIVLKPEELEFHTMRSGGAGGQHVNKTESAVQVHHKPTGIFVRCQQQRSQGQNKEMALQMLKSRLYDLEMKKRLAEKDKAEAQKMEASFGSQIRNYVMAPYQLVKDLRSGHETGNVQGILDGELQPFVESYLLHIADTAAART
jgi:peptide chain release factor 2